MAITDAMLDRAKRDEKELAIALEGARPSVPFGKILPRLNAGHNFSEE
jgi:hypothetical protein